MNEFTVAFWLVCLALLALAASFIAVPIWRTRRGAWEVDETARIQANVALFRERKHQLEMEFAAGEFDREQFDTLLLELQTSLLTDVNEEEPKAGAVPEAFSRSAPAVLAPLILMALLPLAAWLMYRQWGQLDDVELMDQFQRSVAASGDPEAAGELALSLGQAVRDDPDRPWAWYFLGENLSTLGMFDVANSAFRQAAGQMIADEEKALALGRVALTAYILAQFEITPEVRGVIDEALALNPDEPNILQLLASEAEENGDYDTAIGYWRRLSQLNPDSQSARENIANLQRLRDGGEAVGPTIEVAVAIAEELQLDSRLRVFVAARNAEVQGMPPLAVADLAVADLPARIRLDDSMAVGPFNLSSASRAFVGVLVSQSGSANRGAGDYFVESEPFPVENPPPLLELVVSELVP